MVHDYYYVNLIPNFIQKIFSCYIFSVGSQFWYLGVKILISLRCFSLTHYFGISLNSYLKKYFSFDSFPAEAFAGRPRLQPHNNRRSGRTCFDSCSAPVLPFNCLIQYSPSMVSTSITFQLSHFTLTSLLTCGISNVYQAHQSPRKSI